MPLHSGPIVTRQAAVGLEPHDAFSIKQQDGRPRHVQTLGERIQRGTVDVVEISRSTERAAYRQADGELSIGRRRYSPIRAQWCPREWSAGLIVRSRERTRRP